MKEIFRRTSEKESQDGRFIINACWTLLFRAMCLHRDHISPEGQTRGYGAILLPSTFHGSKLPMYIA